MKYFKLMVVGCFLLLFNQCKRPLPGGNKIGEPVVSADLKLLDSITILNTSTLRDSTFLIMFFFDPYCQFCREETDSVLSHINEFRQTQFCFLGIESLKEVNGFSKSFKLNTYPNIVIGIDTAYTYAKYFNVTGVPHISVYSKGKLKAVFPYKAEVNELLSIIN